VKIRVIFVVADALPALALHDALADRVVDRAP
jgi:hypothetical protein